MVYGDQRVVDTKIEELKTLSKDKLLAELLKVNEDIIINDTRKRNCQSDFSYWSFVARDEELSAIKSYIEDQLKNHLIENNVKFVNTAELDRQRLNTIISKKNEVINNLSEYKPSGYKRIIEFINKIFSEE